MAYQPKSYKKFVATAATATLVATAVVPAAFADEAVTAAFTDVPASYTDAVSFLIENNFAVGVTPTQFGISAEITRGDAAIIIASAAGLKDEKAAASGFTDVPKRGAIAVNSLKAAGVVNGTSATKFGWDQPIKRGDAALMFAKAFGLTEGSATDVKFTDVPDRYKEAVAALLANNVTKGINATQYGTDNNIKRGDFAKFVYALEDKIELDAPTNVESVTATNGVITVKFAAAPSTTPTAADFKVTRTINSGATVDQSPTVTYDAATRTATLAVPTVAQADVAQTVSYSVKYQETAPVVASFNIAAPTQAAAVVTAGSEGGNTVYVYFNAAVDSETATNVGNYRVDTNTGSTADTTVIPTSVSLNTTAVGGYGAGQVATLNFAGAPITATPGAVRVEGVKSNGVTVPTATVSYGTAVLAADDTAPALSTPTLTNGISAPSANLDAAVGTDVTVQVTAIDTANFVAGGQFRVLNTAGTEVKGWSALSATNAPFDNRNEGLTGKLSTTGLAIGTYTVQFRATDAAANTNAAATYATATLTILPANADVTAPAAASISTTNYSNVAITGANAQGARTVRVTGLATDTSNLAAAPAGVAKVDYRVRQYNTATGVYTDGTWTNASATDGSFGGATEAFNFVTPALNIGGSYIIETRVTDNAGNVSAVTAVPSVTGTGTTGTTPGLAAPSTGTFTIANDVIAPVVGPLAPTTSLTPTNVRDLTFTGAASDATVVSAVQFAVYRDNGTGTRELVRDFSSAGVTATDGAFDEAGENFSIDYTLPNVSGTYYLEVIAVDAAGNRSTITADTTRTRVLDVTPPTATITPNTATVEDNYDFVVTFSEAISTGVQVTDFEVRNALGQTTNLGLLTGASNIAPTGTANQYIINVEGADQSMITAGNTLNVVGATTVDLAGNEARGTYTITAADLD